MRSHNIKHRLTRGSSKVSPLPCLLICGALCHGAWLGWCGVGTDSGQRSGELTPVSGLLCIVPNPELDAANFQRSRQQRLRTKANFLTESRTFCSGQVVSNFLSLSRHPDQACISYISPCELVQHTVHTHSTLTIFCDIWYNCCRCHFHTYLTAKYKKFNWLFCCWLLFTCLCQQKQQQQRATRDWKLVGFHSFQFIKRRQL